MGVKETIQVILSLVAGYLVISAAAEAVLGIKLPEPFFTGHPSTVILSDPSYGMPYNRTVDTRILQDTLNGFHYGRAYVKGEFDCSDMSKELARHLQEDKGYDTSVIGDDPSKHAWVYVWTGKNEAWAIEVTEESALARGSSGEILGDDWWDYFWSLKTVFDTFRLPKGGPQEFYYPTLMRDGLHVLEWNEVTDEM